MLPGILLLAPHSWKTEMRLTPTTSVNHASSSHGGMASETDKKSLSIQMVVNMTARRTRNLQVKSKRKEEDKVATPNQKT